MLNSMFDIMARINELKSRFGLTGNSVLKKVTENDNAADSFNKNLKEASSQKSEPLFHPDRPVSREEIEKIINFYSQQKGISPDLVKALVQTGSGYNSEAVSKDGALGLMQLRPATFDKLGITDPFDPDENLKGGISLLSDLLENYSGDYRKALDAYNAAGKTNEGIDSGSLKSRNYSERIIDFYIKGDE